MIRLGRSTLVISIPSDWVRMNGLKSGDIVNLETQSDGALVLYPSETRTFREIEVTIYVDQFDKDSEIAREILSYYLNGYNTIKVASSKVLTVRQQRLVRQLAQKLYMNIISATSSEMVMQSLIDLSKIPLDTSLTRMYTITYSMFSDLVKALENYDHDLAVAIISLDDEVDNFSYLLLRLLRTMLAYSSTSEQFKISRNSCLDGLIVVQNMEYIADNIVNVAQRILGIIEEKRRFPKELLELLKKLCEECIKYYDDAFRAYISVDSKLSNRILERRTTFNDINSRILESLIKQQDPVIVCATCTINSNIQAIIASSSRIAEAAINKYAITRK
ncbi:MAG: phosphate uptake regulator PhoU [Candidatus Micrarchaeia archaeon]